MSTWINRFALVVVAAMLVNSAQAQVPFAPPGSGTTEDPYRISQLGHLAWMSDHEGDKAFVLQNDMDATVTKSWNGGAGFAPIPFGGTFDGNGMVISNLYINRPTQEDVGLFGRTWSGVVIKNLGLTGCSVKGSSVVGAIAGDFSPGGLVSNCYATGIVEGGGNCIGGLVGTSSGTISGCYATGSVRGNFHTGGLLGYNVYEGGTVSNCHATGAVTGSSWLGGLVGDNSAVVTECYATGPVTATNSNARVGGLVGENGNQGTVNACYATGAITAMEGNSYVGGLAGLNQGKVLNSYATGPVVALDESRPSTCGGLVGNNPGGAVIACYALGTVTVAGDPGTGWALSAGGLIAQGTTDTVLSAYWDTQASGLTSSGAGTGRSTVQMKKQSTFIGWDFATVWGILENESYPFLRWQGPFTGAVDLGKGWKWLSWFGAFYDAGNGWVFHLQHGWMYTVGTNPSSLFFWATDIGWLWTSNAMYPYLYRFSDNAWLWYLIGTSDPRWFLNLHSETWEPMH